MRAPGKEWIDEFDYIIPHPLTRGDAGDSGHRMFMANALYMVQVLWRTDPVAADVPVLLWKRNPGPDLIQNGLVRRHPHQGWCADWDRGSRDLLVHALAWAAVHNAPEGKELARSRAKTLWLLASNWRRNGMTKEQHGTQYGTRDGKPLIYNYNRKIPDLLGPTTWALMIRASYAHPVSPVTKLLTWLLPILDLKLLIVSILKRLSKAETNDVNSFLMAALASRFKHSTIASRLAWRIIDPVKTIKWLKAYYEYDTKLPDGRIGGHDPWWMVDHWEPVLKHK